MHQPDITPLAPGAELAEGYTVVEHLRRGDALDVYDLFSAERGCRCIGKVVAGHRTDQRAPARLVMEGELLLSLSHPHLVRAYELLDGPILILETLTGETLDFLVTEYGPLEAAEAAHLGQHLCSAVGYLHRRGWLHLDLKPENVIAMAGMAKLLDLSLAMRPGLVGAGHGTRAYMAPEQARGGEVGAAADMWGLGAVLVHALTGASPTAGARIARADLPRRMAAAVEACLAPEPADRPTVAELCAGLADLADPLARAA